MPDESGKQEALNKLLKQLDATENCVVVYTPKEGKPKILADTRKKIEKEN
jgi:hypothetical protein